MYLSYLYTVEPLWATTFHKRQLKSKILKFSQSKPYGRNLSFRNTSRKRPQQYLRKWSDLCVHSMLYAA